MRFFRPQGVAVVLAVALSLGFCFVSTQQTAFAQETTGGMQGTVKDPSGAVVPGAKITVTSPALIGSKVLITDSSGYYHFANLPAGTYSVTVTAKVFETSKLDGLTIE